MSEILVGDDEAGSHIGEVQADGAPPVDVGAGKHVQLGNLEGAVIDNSDMAAELVLDHGEFVLGSNKRVGVGAGPIRTRIAKEAEEP